MKRILVPVDRSRNSLLALDQAIADSRAAPVEVHLVNVQPAFSRHVAQFVSHHDRDEYHRSEAEAVLAPCRERLAQAGVAHQAHLEVGDSAECIADLAARLGADLILMATGRKNALTRLVECSVTNRLIEITRVPVEVVAGDAQSGWERFGIPVAVAGAAAAAVALAS